jgi:alcohol dehydrogenase
MATAPTPLRRRWLCGDQLHRRRYLGQTLRCLHRGGRLLTCGATAGFDPKTGFATSGLELHIIGANGWKRVDLRSAEPGADWQNAAGYRQSCPLHEAQKAAPDRRALVIGKVIVTP